jgi:hypothetical protein
MALEPRHDLLDPALDPGGEGLGRHELVRPRVAQGLAPQQHLRPRAGLSAVARTSHNEAHTLKMRVLAVAVHLRQRRRRPRRAAAAARAVRRRRRAALCKKVGGAARGGRLQLRPRGL